MDDTKQLYEILKRRPNKTWGFVVYRTTYNNDADWERAMEAIRENLEKGVTLEDPEMEQMFRQRMDWKFVDDKASLNGATRADLRERFLRWVDSEQGRRPAQARYVFFLEIDESSLRSIIDLGAMDAHYNLVHSHWRPGMNEEDENENENEDEDQSLQPIDGCRQEDVGWMKVQPILLGPDFCSFVEMYLEDHSWKREYVRPPGVHNI